MSAAGLGSRAIIGNFFARLSELTGQSWLDLISMEFDSNQESETYKWLGQVPAMKEWLGGRNAKSFSDNGITIVNKLFEGTLQVTLDEIRRDKTGQVNIRIAELAQRALSHWNKLLSTLITNGTGATSGLCYDGQYFFDSDHSEGNSGTQKNLLTNSEVAALDVTTATAPTAIEAAKAILGVIGYMMGIKDNEGEPMNENAQKFLLMTSPALWQHMAGGVHSEKVGSGEDNPVQNIIAKEGFSVGIFANARLAYTTQFVIFRTDAPAKALIRQNEEPIKMVALAEGSDEEFHNRRHLYSIEAIRNVGYGYWQYAAHATLS
jgi:phage major head subunit gpT-like protein